MNQSLPCWCGHAAEDAFDEAYRRCRGCGTLVSTAILNAATYLDVDEQERGHYGRDYWFDRVPNVLGQPSLAERARADLGERAVAWLEWLRRYLGPGAATLDVGCAHGAFVYLLKAAGYRAVGLEMSRDVIAFARDRFGIDVHRGPLERWPADDRFDAVSAMDVLEHLPDPVATLEACRARLRDGGVLLLQTPCYRGEGSDWEMLIPQDHLFLLTEAGARQMLARAGFAAVETEPGLFPYDMWITAAVATVPSRREPSDPPPLVEALSDSWTARQDASEALTEARRSAVEVAADRDAKGEVVDRLEAELRSVEGDRRAKDAVIVRLESAMAAVDADRRAKDAVIARLQSELAAVDADRQAKGAVVTRLETELAAVDADRKDKDTVIERLAGELAAVDADRRAKDEVIGRLGSELETAEEDRRVKNALIERLNRALEGPGTRGE